MRGWFLSGLFLTGVSLALTAGALAQAPVSPPPQSGKEAAKKEPPPPPKLDTKVFRLQHCDPEEIRNVLEQLLEEEVTPLPGGGELMPAPGGLGMMGGGFGMIGGFGMLGGPPPGAIPWRLSINTRSGTVIVRGRAQDLQVASDVVAVLDLPEGKAPPKVKTVQALVLKHAEPGELAEIVRNLELPVRVVPLEEAKMVVGAGSEDALRELNNLIQQLDLPERKLDEKKLKRLGVGGGGA